MFTKQAAGIVCPAVFFYGCIEKFISALNTLKTTKKASYSRLFVLNFLDLKIGLIRIIELFLKIDPKKSASISFRVSRPPR